MPSSSASLHDFGRYEILSQVGKGSFATVYRARMSGAHGFSKIVALKLIDIDLNEDNQSQARALINEARLGGHLNHRGIVEFYDFGELDGRLYIAMEYVDGLTLAQIQRRLETAGERIPIGLVIEIGQAIAAGLAYAHDLRPEDSIERLKVVHRDLKPQNIMLGRNGETKILDFGIASSTTALFRTAHGDIPRGTPAYMSPEQLDGNLRLDGRADLFALGTIIIEMTTGIHPFLSHNLPSVFHAILSRDLTQYLDLVAEHSPALATLVEQLMHRDRDRRPQTAREVSEALYCLRLQHPPKIDIPDLIEMAEAVDSSAVPGVDSEPATVSQWTEVPESESSTLSIADQSQPPIGTPKAAARPSSPATTDVIRWDSSPLLSGTGYRRYEARSWPIVVGLVGLILLLGLALLLAFGPPWSNQAPVGEAPRRTTHQAESGGGDRPKPWIGGVQAGPQAEARPGSPQRSPDVRDTGERSRSGSSAGRAHRAAC
jgi:serine/threonine-protein kinase